VGNNVHPIPLSDAVEAVVTTALRRAERELRRAHVGGPDALCSVSGNTVVRGVDVRVDVTVRGTGRDIDVPARSATASRAEVFTDDRKNPLGVTSRRDLTGAADHNFTAARQDADGAALNFPGSRDVPAARLLAAHARVARQALAQVEAADVGTAAWGAVL